MRLDPARLKKIEIIYEDDALLAVDKPGGLASQPGADDKRSILEVLEASYEPPLPLHLCHRLDRATTGVLLLAKSSAVASQIAKSWDQTRKTYVAVAAGAWSGPRRIVTPIDSERGSIEAETIVQGAKLISHELGPLSLLALELGTGRMHQIRKHLAGLGHPILLDDRYGHFATNKLIFKWIKARGAAPKNQQLLHALRLELPHPTQGASLKLEAALPEAFRVLLGEDGDHLGELLSEANGTQVGLSSSTRLASDGKSPR